MRRTIAFFFVTSLLHTWPARAGAARTFYALNVDSAVAAEADSVFRRTDTIQTTTVHVLEQEQVRYYAATVKTLPFPIDTVWKALGGAGNDLSEMKYVRTCRRECGVGGVPDSCAWYIEVGVSLARSWFLCDIDTIREGSVSRRVVLFGQNNDSLLTAKVRKYPRGLIIVEYEMFIIEWWLEQRGNATRVGMFAVVDPDIWIPQWLFKAVSRSVFPSMLSSFEKHIAKKQFKERVN